MITQIDYNTDIANRKRMKQILLILSEEILRLSKFANLPPAERNDILAS